MLGRTDRPELDDTGRQVVHIEVGTGYQPAVVTVRPGAPIRLVFDRVDDNPCTERVIFSAPRLERRLASSGSTSVDLPEQGSRP